MIWQYNRFHFIFHSLATALEFAIPQGILISLAMELYEGPRSGH